MFGNHQHAYDYNSPDFQQQGQQTLIIPKPPQLILPEHETLRSGYTSSGCSSYGGSPTSYGAAYAPVMIPRSHSFHQNMEVYSPLNSSPPAYFECESSSVRKVLSAGDLQGVNMSLQRSSSPLVNESSIIESMNRANPYSPEEKKERIERYKSKRNLRNFNKKIKYECRKTLADSRPRIRGRFARNDELEQIKNSAAASQAQCQWEDNTASFEEEDDQYDDDDNNWINFLDAFSANLLP